MKSRSAPTARIVPSAAIAVALPALALAGCASAQMPKPDAADQVLVLGEEATAELEAAGIEPVTFVEIADVPCPDEEKVLYRVVARYSIAVDPGGAEAVLTSIHDLWVEENEYQELDGGIYWGESDFALSRVEGDDAQYSAALHPDRTAITVSINTECFEDPDEEVWFDPIAPADAPQTDED